MATDILFLNFSFAMIGLDWLHCQFQLVNVGLDQLTSVWIGYCQSRLVNIRLDGLNIKTYRLILVRKKT